jgi:hypothetical protein
MVKLLGKISKIWNFFRNPSVIIFSVVIIFIYGVYLFSYNRIAGDAASHLLLAVSPILKIGVPYKDFWEIKPPVWPFILYLWTSVFGFKILSIRILNLIVAALVVIIGRLIYKKVLITPVFEMVFIFTMVVTFSPILYSYMFLPTELLGLLLSMFALVSLMFFKNDFNKFYWSGFLFLAASQTKEPFTFCVLAVMPVLLETLLKRGFGSFIKNTSQFLLGIISGVLILYLYLSSFGSVNAYMQVFQYKQRFFRFTYEKLVQNFMPGFSAAERTFTEFSYGLLFISILAILMFLLANKFRKNLKFNSKLQRLESAPLIVLDKDSLNKYVVLLYAIGSFLGFGLGGSYGQHYLIQIVFPFYLLLGVILSYIFREVSFLAAKPKIYLIPAIVIFLFSILITLPKRQYFLSFLPYATTNRNFVMNDDIAGFERRMAELTTEDQCVLSVYGWGASENYLYSERRPCTRFFLANIVKEGWQNNEYAQSILNNPPAAIYYRTNASDMDVGKFESEVIDISNIIKNCYVEDTVENVIYIPKIKNDDEGLKRCIKSSSGIEG